MALGASPAVASAAQAANLSEAKNSQVVKGSVTIVGKYAEGINKDIKGIAEGNYAEVIIDTATLTGQQWESLIYALRVARPVVKKVFFRNIEVTNKHLALLIKFTQGNCFVEDLGFREVVFVKDAVFEAVDTALKNFLEATFLLSSLRNISIDFVKHKPEDSTSLAKAVFYALKVGDNLQSMAVSGFELTRDCASVFRAAMEGRIKHLDVVLSDVTFFVDREKNKRDCADMTGDLLYVSQNTPLGLRVGLSGKKPMRVTKNKLDKDVEESNKITHGELANFAMSLTKSAVVPKSADAKEVLLRIKNAAEEDVQRKQIKHNAEAVFKDEFDFLCDFINKPEGFSAKIILGNLQIALNAALTYQHAKKGHGIGKGTDKTEGLHNRTYVDFILEKTLEIVKALHNSNAPLPLGPVAQLSSALGEIISKAKKFDEKLVEKSTPLVKLAELHASLKKALPKALQVQGQLPGDVKKIVDEISAGLEEKRLSYSRSATPASSRRSSMESASAPAGDAKQAVAVAGAEVVFVGNPLPPPPPPLLSQMMASDLRNQPLEANSANALVAMAGQGRIAMAVGGSVEANAGSSVDAQASSHVPDLVL